MTSAPRGRLLLVHRYFSPDTPPYATILSRIATALAQEGYDVTVLTGQPSYSRATIASAAGREVIAGVHVRRWRVIDDRRSSLRKIANLVWFCVRLVVSFPTFRRADVVMAATTPPVVVALVCSLLARVAGARFVYHKQDVWPEVLALQKGDRPGPVLRSLRRLDAGTERRSDAVVVLSGDMARTVEARGTSPAGIRIINNFDPWPLDAERSSFQQDDILDVVFAGNLGKFQGVEALADLVEATSTNPRIRWHFFGDGVLRPMVEELAVRGGVDYHGHRSPKEVANFVATRADLGVVSLNSGVIRAAYPSKTMTYLRNGCPLLALVEDGSELSTMVRDRQIGVAGRVDDIRSVADRLAALALRPEDLLAARKGARNAYEELFAVELQLAKWSSLMSEMVEC